MNKEEKQTFNNLNNFIKRLMKLKRNETINKKITKILLNRNEIILDYDLIKNEIEEQYNNETNNILKKLSLKLINLYKKSILNSYINIKEKEMKKIYDKFNKNMEKMKINDIKYNEIINNKNDIIINNKNDIIIDKKNDIIINKFYYIKLNNIKYNIYYNYEILNKYIEENNINEYYIFGIDKMKKNNTISKKYIIIDNIDERKNILNNNHNIYEVLMKNNYKLFFDIELEEKKDIEIYNKYINNIDLFFNDLKIMINDFINYINKYHNIYNKKLDENNIIYLKSENEELNKKISYHIIFNEISYDNHEYIKYIIQKYKKDNNNIISKYIDDCVYRKNGLYRCINQSKINKNNELKLYNNDYNIDDTLINIKDKLLLHIEDKEFIKNKEIKIKIKNDINNYINNDDKKDDKLYVEITKEEENLILKLRDKKDIIYNIIDKIKNHNENTYEWFNIVLAIKVLTNDYELYKNFNGNKYDINGNLKIWNGMKDNYNIDNYIISINCLLKYLKINDNKYYKKIKKDFEIITDINIKYDNIKKSNEINNFYNIDKTLINKYIELSKEDLKDNKYLYEDTLIKAYNDNYRNIIVKSGLGSGKSVSVCNFLKHYINNINDKAKILILSPRILYSYTIKQTLEEGINGKNNEIKYKFDLYNDKEININESQFLICSMTSILKLKNNYDIIVMDEIESLLNVYSNYKTHIDFLFNYNKFYDLINCSKVNLLLDGDINNTSLKIFSTINKQSILYNNINNFKNRVVNIFKYEETFNKKLFDDIKNNKKIVIFNYSKNGIIKFVKQMKEDYKDKKIIAHYSNSDDNELFLERENNNDNNLIIDDEGKLKNINEIWNKYDILIMNVSITVGIDFTEKYFNNVYIIYDNINIVRDVIQSINRIRNYIDNEINIYINKREIDYNEEYLKIDEKKKLLMDKIINDEYFINEYNEYIKNYNLKLDDLDYGLEINKIDKVLNINEYLNKIYDNMDENLLYLHKRALNEINLSKYNLSMFHYFFKKVGYTINYDKTKSKIIEELTKLLGINVYELANMEYEKEFKKYFNLLDDYNINNINKDELYKKNDELYKYISDEQKNNNKQYKKDMYDLIKQYIKFNKYFKINSDKDNLIDGIFKEYISPYTNQKFKNYYNYMNDIKDYENIKNQLKKHRCLEMTKNIYEYNELRNVIFKHMNINKENINKNFVIKENELKELYLYIDNNIDKFRKIENINRMLNKKNKNDNINYSIIKSFLINYNISIRYFRNNYSKNDENKKIVINDNNYFEYIELNKYDNKNNKNDEIIFIDE
jgi:hypothetical protein